MASEQPISHEGLEYSLQLLNKKWVPYICYYLTSSKKASMRYAELKRALPFDISDKVFSNQLRDLIETGILVKKTDSDSHGNAIHSYRLTRKGHSFSNILFLLKDWGSVNRILDAEQKIAEGAGVNFRRVYQSPTNGRTEGSDAIVWTFRRERERERERDDAADK